MIAGGLAGASPHMISATITAISRLMFEFRGKVSFHIYAIGFTHFLQMIYRPLCCRRFYPPS